MGNSGGMIVARCAAAELLGIAGAAGFEEACHGEDLAGEWAAVQYADRPVGGGTVVARQTGEPVFTVAYLDSDVGFVEAVTPLGSRWKALLNRKRAEGYGMPLDRYPVDPAVAGALAWAAAAGLTADAAGVRAALTGEEALAEDLTDRLLVALGIAPGAAAGAA
ncbi:hypothetical protein ACFCV9_13975 [Streptomyces sp. NPDC056367]|uniref:hypothetical protein n=2 Tax=unclassified Streptomyces TaxID=2593676 RepID=UPI0035DF7CD7